VVCYKSTEKAFMQLRLRINPLGDYFSRFFAAKKEQMKGVSYFDYSYGGYWTRVFRLFCTCNFFIVECS
jgi:hypothetical protein